MLRWALNPLVVALVAVLLGYGRIAGAASGIASILFWIFVVLFVITLLISLITGKKLRADGCTVEHRLPRTQPAESHLQLGDSFAIAANAFLVPARPRRYAWPRTFVPLRPPRPSCAAVPCHYSRRTGLQAMLRRATLLLTLVSIAGSQQLAQADILGTARSFAVLASSTVTNTGATVVSGSLGVSPGTAISGFPPGIVINGTIHSGGAVAAQAQADTTTAYNFLAGLPTTQNLTDLDLGGMLLTPGVYFFSSSAQLTGTLTLNTQGDPDALFVFQIGSTLTTASDSSVVTINGPNDCNIYWQIGSSATLGTNTSFQGNILAEASITLNTDATIVQGRALARSGAVTLDSNEIVAGCTCFLDEKSLDCNDNGIPDECDIADGTSLDCNDNGIPDECEILFDCNDNGIPDDCDIAEGTSLDCNDNGVPDECDIADGTSLDCNGNGVPDECDIADGTSLDCNLNGIPDECEKFLDCNDNGIPDECDIADGTSSDCNENGIPDECDIADGTSRDCNRNGIPDECELAQDCNRNGIPDACDIANGTSLDCNGNGVPDECELADGTSLDCNGNGIPDECDIADGTSLDCNGNGVPDECELADGTSLDCNGNGIPDECDIAGGTSLDCNGNGIPDECDIADGTSQDCNDNGIPDECDGGCAIDCIEFNRFENLTQNDTLTLITNFHNPQSHQGYVYLFAIDGANDAIGFDWLIGQTLIVDGLSAFDYSFNAVDYRAMVAEGALTDLDGDGIRDLNGIEYEFSPGELLVPRFLGQGNGQPASKLILIGLSGGALFDTTVDFLIYNDNEEEFSAEHTFRCWAKVDLLTISGAFHNDFLVNWTGHNPNESVGNREYGWFRVFGGVAVSPAFAINEPAIYATYVERSGSSMSAADLPFEICTRSGHLLPRSLFGDNEEQAAGGISDRDCTVNIARRRPGSLLLYSEFDNRVGVVSVLTVTNTNPLTGVRINMRYIGRFTN